MSKLNQTLDLTDSCTKEEGNRNVMLNAASANGPREIQIGLPSADVNVLENGLPVTYATNPHSVNTIWRGDASLSHQGLLKIAETAITTGKIDEALFTTELSKKFSTSTFRLGVNEWFYHIDYCSNTTMYDQSVNFGFTGDFTYIVQHPSRLRLM